MHLTLDMLDGSPIPKRGDLLQSNPGNKRERTWFVLSVHTLKPIKGVPRCCIWAERWWEVEPNLRVMLFRSAERRDGQQVIQFKRYPAKRKRSMNFEQYMRAI